MQPIHISIAISSYSDISLPLMLVEANKGVQTPFRVSVFLNNEKLVAQVDEMGKIFGQIKNNSLRRLLDGGIECFSKTAEFDQPVDILMANSLGDIQDIKTPSHLTILNQLPDQRAFNPEYSQHSTLLTPFKYQANIEIANYSKKFDVPAIECQNLGCFTRERNLIIYVKNEFSSNSKKFQKNEEVFSAPLSPPSIDIMPSSLPSLAFIGDFLRSWQLDASSTMMRRKPNGLLAVEEILISKGKVIFKNNEMQNLTT